MTRINIRMFRILFVILPVVFLGQACNFLFGDIYGDQPSGSRGVFLSTDSGDTWEAANNISRSDQNLSTARILRLLIEPDKSENILAASINQGLFGSDSRAKEWVQLLPNFAAYDAFIHPTNREEIFAAGSRGGFAAIFKSADRGSSWFQIYTQPLGEAAVTTLLYDPQNPRIFYAGLTSGTLLKSTDLGTTWKAAGEFKDRIVATALAADSGTIYVLTRNQGLKQSRDGGKIWTEVMVSSDIHAFNDLFLDSKNASVLYVGTARGLYKSADRGGSWTKLNLPADVNVSDVSTGLVNANNSRQIFAAIRSTIYRSDDGGTTWRTVSLSTGRIVSDIVIDSSEPNRVYAGLR